MQIAMFNPFVFGHSYKPQFSIESMIHNNINFNVMLMLETSLWQLFQMIDFYYVFYFCCYFCTISHLV